MMVSIIVAMSENRVIGKDGGLPWKLSADLTNFKRLTQGHVVLMGRKTFESIGAKPLKNRENLIVSKKLRFVPPGCRLFNDMDKAVDYARSKDERELFIVGGAGIYEKALTFADRIYLTQVHTSIEGGCPVS